MSSRKNRPSAKQQRLNDSSIKIIGYYLQENVLPIIDNSLLVKTVALLCRKCLRILYSAVGVICLYSLVNCLIERKGFKVPLWIINLSPLCFGIYLFQQFILQLLYYRTNLPSVLEPNLLLWAGLVITIIVSYSLTTLVRMTRFGRWLM